MNIATLLMFTKGFNGENQFFSHCKKSNIDLSIKAGICMLQQYAILCDPLILVSKYINYYIFGPKWPTYILFHIEKLCINLFLSVLKIYTRWCSGEQVPVPLSMYKNYYPTNFYSWNFNKRSHTTILNGGTPPGRKPQRDIFNKHRGGCPSQSMMGTRHAFFSFFFIVSFTSYFVYSIDVFPHSPGVVYYHLLLRRETRIPGVAPFSSLIGIWDIFVHKGQESYTPTTFGNMWTTPGVKCMKHASS